MEIQELPDINIVKGNMRNEPLLEYVWIVANEFLMPPMEYEEDICDSSYAPISFADRYAASKLTEEERDLRYKEGGWKYSKYFKNNYRIMDTSFKERFLQNEDLQNTIEAFNLDVSKFWYLLLFVYDYIQDWDMHCGCVGKSTLEELNVFTSKLETATGIKLKNNNRKSYETDREDIMNHIRTVFEYYTKCYNHIIQELPQEEWDIELKKMGLNAPIEQRFHPSIKKKGNALYDISTKKAAFATMFLFFLKDRKARTLPNKKAKVSKDKLMFISRLIYTVGYDKKRYNEEFNKKGNKNRLLSNLLRKYGTTKLPQHATHHYW